MGFMTVEDIEMLGGRVLIKPILIKPSEESRLVLPDSFQGKMSTEADEGEIIKVGDVCEWAEPGDIVLYGRYAGSHRLIGADNYIVLQEDDIFARKKREVK